VSNVQLDDSIRISLLEEEGFKSAPKQRLRAVHSRSEVQKRWRSDYRL